MAPWGGQLRQACKAIGAAGAVKGADHAITPCTVLRAASCSSRQRISQHNLQNLSYLLVLLSCAEPINSLAHSSGLSMAAAAISGHMRIFKSLVL